MTTLTFVQGDDLEIEFYYESWNGSAWVAQTLTGADFAMTLKKDDFEQAMTFVSVDAAAGHGRFTLAAGLSAALPITTLGSNIRVIDTGRRSSTLPLAIKVVEDFTE